MRATATIMPTLSFICLFIAIEVAAVSFQTVDTSSRIQRTQWAPVFFMLGLSLAFGFIVYFIIGKTTLKKQAKSRLIIRTSGDIPHSVETAKPMGYLKPKTKTKRGFWHKLQSVNAIFCLHSRHVFQSTVDILLQSVQSLAVYVLVRLRQAEQRNPLPTVSRE